MTKYALGWLGWSEKEALASDVNSVMIAMEGKIEMLYPEAKKKEITPDKFKQFVKLHNRRLSEHG